MVELDLPQACPKGRRRARRHIFFLNFFKQKDQVHCSEIVLTPTFRLQRLQLHGAIYCPDSFVLMLHHCVNLKTIRNESMSLNRIAGDKLHRVIVAKGFDYMVRFV